MNLTPALTVPLRRWLPASLALLLLNLAPAAPIPAFDAALAELKHARISAGDVIKTTDLAAWNETFFTRLDLAILGPREIAEIHRLNAFSYSDKVKVHARLLVERLEPMAAAPDEDGALAAALLVPLSGPGGKGPQRAGWEAAALIHPAYFTLLNGNYGDIALDVACRTAPSDDAKRAFMLGLAGKLDATRSSAAAGMIRTYWSRILEFVPEGEQRQAIRRRLVGYLAAAQTQAAKADAEPRHRQRIEDSLAKLDGPEARGELIGRMGAELNFIWSSREGWKALSDLRGKVVVLDFWATWCGPCVASFPEVGKLVERYRATEVQVVGVTSLQGNIVGLEGKVVDCRGDPEKEMRLMTDYIQERKLTWPVVFSREPVFNPDYGVGGIPTTVVIAPDGTVRYKASGYAGPKLEQAIDAVLAEFKLKAPAAP